MKPEDFFILIGCEESQVVTIAFRERGFNAFSCDLQECSGGRPDWHLQMDVFEAIKMRKWDLMIAFPPCTHLAVSGARHFEQKRKDGRQQESLEFVRDLMNAAIPKIAIENPVGIIGSRIFWYVGGENGADERWEIFPSNTIGRKADQIIQPFYFGDPQKKTTCLWLKGLPRLAWSGTETLFYLKTTVIPNFTQYNSKKTKSGKSNYSDFGKLGKGKGKERSKTFPGIANALAEQYGNFLLNQSL